MFFNSQTEPEQNHIISAFIFELSKVEAKSVRERMVGQLANVSATIAQRVANGLGLQGTIEPIQTTVAARTDLPTSDALSIVKKAIPGLATRVVGCMVADGSDSKAVMALQQAVVAAGATMRIIAPKIGGAVASDKTLIEADFQLAGGSSVLFDTVYVCLSKGAATLLSTEAAAVAWVHDAFAHLKVIGATASSAPLLDAAGVVADEGILLGNKTNAYLSKAAQGRIWSREQNVRTMY